MDNIDAILVPIYLILALRNFSSLTDCESSVAIAERNVPLTWYWGECYTNKMFIVLWRIIVTGVSCCSLVCVWEILRVAGWGVASPRSHANGIKWVLDTWSDMSKDSTHCWTWKQINWSGYYCMNGETSHVKAHGTRNYIARCVMVGSVAAVVVEITLQSVSSRPSSS